MKKLLLSLSLLSVLVLVACGSTTKEDAKEETNPDTGNQIEEAANDATNNGNDKAEKIDNKEVKDGPLTEPGEWKKDGDSKITLIKVADVNQVHEIGTIKLTIESVKLLNHSGLENDVKFKEYFSTVHGKDIGDELNTIQIIYSVENTTDDNIMFHAIKTVTTDTKAQLDGLMHNIATNTDNGTYMGQVVVEGLTTLPYFNGSLEDINAVNIITGDVWDNDNPTKLSDSQKITIEF